MIRSNRKYLDPSLLARLGRLELVARCAVEGFFSGRHPSPVHGFNVEYSDRRSYQAGDELRYLDWKAYARSNRLYIKQSKQQTNTTVHIALDCSGSMGFASAQVSKLDFGCFLAAAVAYLALQQNDRVCLARFADRILEMTPALSRRNHLNTIFRSLETTTAQGKTDLAHVVHTLAETIKPRSMILVLSDFLSDAPAARNALAHLRHYDHDVILFHILDDQEVNFDYHGLIEFADMESSAALKVKGQDVARAYRQRITTFTDDLQRFCGRNDIHYCLLNTADPLDRAFPAYLMRRRRRLSTVAGQ